MTTAKKNAAGLLPALELLRVSTPKQALLGGLETQHDELVKLAALKGYTLSRQIRLAGVSGAAVRLTSEFDELERLLVSGEFAAVLMVEDTRLMRPDEPEDYALLTMFKNTSVKICTLNAEHDMSTPDGQMVVQILMAISGRERQRIRERTMRGRNALRAAGMCATGNHSLPLALTSVLDARGERKAFAWNADEVPAVQRLFELFVNGTTNMRELTLATGIKYGRIRSTLQNTSYIGVRTYDECVVPNGKGNVYNNGRLVYQKKVRRAESEVERVAMLGADGKSLAGIVSEATFRRAQTLLAHCRENRSRRKVTEPENFLFRGFLRCAECGSSTVSVTHSSGGTKREYYVCRLTWGAIAVNPDGSHDYSKRSGSCSSKRMRREQVEATIERILVERFTNPTTLFKVVEQYRKQRRCAAASDNSAARLTKELEKIEKQLAKLKVLFRVNDMSEVEYLDERSALQQRQEKLNAELVKIHPQTGDVTLDEFRRMLRPLMKWATLNNEEKRTILSAIAPVIHVVGKGNGGIGAGSKTDIVVRGVDMSVLTGSDDGNDAIGVTNGKSSKVVNAKSPVNTGSFALVNNFSRSRTGKLIDQLVYIPVSADAQKN